MNTYNLVCSHLNTPKTLGELAALTGLHPLGVESQLRELDSRGMLHVPGILKCHKQPHENLYEIPKRMTKELKKKQALFNASELDELVLQALEKHSNLVRSRIAQIVGANELEVRDSLRRLKNQRKIQLTSRHSWSLADSDVLEVKKYPFKTKFVKNRNPWLCAPKKKL